VNTVRPARLDDVPAIARAHVDAWRASYTDLLPRAVLDHFDSDESAKYWRGIIGGRDIRYVAVAVTGDDSVVGFASCGPNRVPDPDYPGELYSIYLLAAHRGAGFGRMLFNAVDQYLRHQQLTPFQLWVVAGNDVAESFYQALGGRRVASQPGTMRGAEIREHAYGFALRN
jgi:ribosomal protein S18 acetylase RimI-like enzyme